MKFYIFSSGSKGNATLIVDKSVHILIDLGISQKKLCKHLDELNLTLADIDFILLTHEHIDHIRGLENLENIEIYGGKNTYKCDRYHVIEPYTPLKYKHMEILPIETSHDAYNPLGFIFKNGKEKLVYITDTGFISEKNMCLAKNANYYILESNHDRKMLLKTARPKFVKDRIMSEFGHLSNEDSALYLSEMIGDKTSQVVLAHVSMEANTYDLPKIVCCNFLKKKKIDIAKIKIIVAKQYEECEGGSNED